MNVETYLEPFGIKATVLSFTTFEENTLKYGVMKVGERFLVYKSERSKIMIGGDTSRVVIHPQDCKDEVWQTPNEFLDISPKVARRKIIQQTAGAKRDAQGHFLPKAA